MKLSIGIPVCLSILSVSVAVLAADGIYVDKDGNMIANLTTGQGSQTLSIYSTGNANQLAYFLEHSDGSERAGILDNVSGNVSVSGSDATDTLVFSDLTLYGNLSVSTGGGDDNVVLTRATVTGDLSVSTHSGDDLVELTNTTLFGKTNIHMSDGQDDVSLSTSTLEGQVTVTTGSGWDDVYVRNSTFVYYAPVFNGESETDTYIDKGGNHFFSGLAIVEDFESVTSESSVSAGAADNSDESTADSTCMDTDGDGYGWNSRATCLVDSSNDSSLDDSAIDNPACIDSDGDGYGWNGSATCLIEAANPETDNSSSSECIDTDGDGWGWDGSASCLVGGMNDIDDEDNPPTIGECIDSDGDGWGWDGVASCFIGPVSLVMPETPAQPEQPAVPVVPEAPAEQEVPVEPRPVIYMIGDTGPGGGIVFSVTNGGTSGLEFAPDVITSQTWGCLGNIIDPGSRLTNNGINVASGSASSNLLASAISNGVCDSPAARSAFDYGPGVNSAVTASDWYLPSTDELIAIRDSNVANVGLAGSPATRYWSSTEDSDTNAFLVLVRATNNPLDTGIPSTSSKSTVANVLPIRSF